MNTQKRKCLTQEGVGLTCGPSACLWLCTAGMQGTPLEERNRLTQGKTGFKDDNTGKHLLSMRDWAIGGITPI